MSKDTFKKAPGGILAGGEDAAMPYLPDGDGRTRTAPVDAARQRHERSLLAIDGVEGVASGRTALGDDAMVVYLRDAAVRDLLPQRIEGFPVETAVTGPIDSGRNR